MDFFNFKDLFKHKDFTHFSFLTPDQHYSMFKQVAGSLN